MQRLAELDEINPNVVNEANKSKKDKAVENNGAHGEETTSPIHGGQKKEKTMENLNLESLRYLAGVKDTIAECGMMGGAGSPASINITAGSGQELTGMLKDIMNLAGVSKVEPHHMPIDNPDAGPSTVISAPPMSGAVGQKMDPNAEMHKLMAIVGEPEQDQDSMNSGDSDDEGDEKKVGEDNDRMYDSSPDEKVMGDPMAQFGDINSGDHRERQKGLPVAKPMETTFKQLMADYEQFIAEGKVAEGKVKDLDADLKDKSMSDEAFTAKYKMSRAEARANLKSKKVKESNHTQHYTDLNPEKKKPGIGSKIAGVAKKVFDKVAPGDDELLTRLEKQTGGKRPNRYNAEGKDEGKPGKNFAKIAKSAGKEYGSKAAGERVAGAVRNKLKKQGKL